jgi:hypothetical protein
MLWIASLKLGTCDLYLLPWNVLRCNSSLLVLVVLSPSVGIFSSIIRLESNSCNFASRWLLCALGIPSNRGGNQRAKLPMEERGDAKLHLLSPRRHSSVGEGEGRGVGCRWGRTSPGASPSEIHVARSTRRRERGHELQCEAPGRVESGQRSGGTAG